MLSPLLCHSNRMLSPFGTGLHRCMHKFCTCIPKQRVLGPQIRKPPISQDNAELFPNVVAPIHAVTRNLQFCWCLGTYGGKADSGAWWRREAEGQRLAVGEPACPRTPAQLSQRGFGPRNTVFHHNKYTSALYPCFWHRAPKSLEISKARKAD